jgi:hypothetical protein
MALTRPDLIEWVEKNEETVIGQLVLYHGPVDLAHVILNPDLWNDSFVSKMKLRLEKSEGLIKTEQVARKKDAKAKKTQKAVIAPTPEEEDLQVQKEKAMETVIAAQEAHAKKWGDCQLPDDDWEPDVSSSSNEDMNGAFDEF